MSVCAAAAEPPDRNRDPVVLSLCSASGELQMELGLLEEVAIVARADGYALNVTFSPDGARYYRNFLDRSKEARVELFICRDALQAFGAGVDMKRDSITVGGLRDRKQAEAMADVLWYGNGCTRYLEEKRPSPCVTSKQERPVDGSGERLDAR